MGSRTHAKVEVGDSAFAIIGDNNGTIDYSTSSNVVDLEALMGNLRQLDEQCCELNSRFLGRETPVSPAKDLVYDIDELEYLTETLQGWPRPMLDLDNMSCSYQKILAQIRKMIEQSRQSMEQDIIHAMGMRAEMRRLRMKLRTAIGVIAYCSNQDERDPHLQEINAVYECICDIQERLENERVLNLRPAQPFITNDLAKIQGEGSAIMNRFMAQSLSLNRISLRDTSMIVSAFVETDLGSRRMETPPEPSDDQPHQSWSQKTEESLKLALIPRSKKDKGRRKIFRHLSQWRIPFDGSHRDDRQATGHILQNDRNRLPRKTLDFFSRKLRLEQHMRCDQCSDIIKLQQVYYICNDCEENERLYCMKCTRRERTCRHELVERSFKPRNVVSDQLLPARTTPHFKDAADLQKGNVHSMSAVHPVELDETVNSIAVATGLLPFFRDHYSNEDM